MEWFIFVLVIGIIGFFLWVNRASFGEHNNYKTAPPPSRSVPAPRPTDTELLSGLPATYYGLAIFCGVVLLIVTIVNAEELTGAEIGAWIGYTVGAVLSMLAVGRVIELLQQIRDAVRNTPALSPDRSDGV